MLNISIPYHCIAQFLFGPSLHTAKILFQRPFNAARPCKGDWSDQNAKGTFSQWMAIIFLYYFLPLQSVCFEGLHMPVRSWQCPVLLSLGQHTFCPAPLPEEPHSATPPSSENSSELSQPLHVFLGTTALLDE